MVSLAGLIDSVYIQTDRPYELKYQPLRAAAELGHQGAQLQIREEEGKLSPAQRQAPQNLRIMMDFLGRFQESGLSSAEIDGHVDLTTSS